MTVLIRRRYITVAATIVGMLLIVVAGVIGYQRGRLAEQRADDEAARADAAVTVAEQLCQQVRDEGGVCVQDPAELRGVQGPPGETGEPGRGIASATCTGGLWRITYTDGTVDTDAGPCTGEEGPAGASGAPGADGEDGVGETGPPGTAGQDGASGADGRSVADIECRETPDGSWRWHITYSDGTTDDDAGPCYDPGPPGLLD